MLDTGVAIGLRDVDPAILDCVSRLDAAPVLSILTLIELEGGVYRSPGQAVRRRQLLATLLETLPVLPLELAAANVYGRIIAQLGFSRRLMLDRMIAAHAISLDAKLVTLNLRDFAGIPDLQLENWGNGVVPGTAT